MHSFITFHSQVNKYLNVAATVVPDTIMKEVAEIQTVDTDQEMIEKEIEIETTERENEMTKEEEIHHIPPNHQEKSTLKQQYLTR